MHDSWGSELGLVEIHSLFEAPLNKDRFLARSQDERKEGQGNTGSASEKGPHEFEIQKQSLYCYMRHKKQILTSAYK